MWATLRLRSFWSGLACGESTASPQYTTKKGDPKAAFHLLRGSIDLVSETAHGSQILGVRRILGYSSYKYTFEFVKENCERQEMTYELSGEDIQPYAPNTLVKAEISQKRIISGPNEVAEKDVPADLLKKLNAQK